MAHNTSRKTVLSRAHEFVSDHRIIGLILITFSAVALIASIILTTDLISILRNPNLNLSCNINPVLSCQSVMKTWQADLLFGIPNSLLGIVVYSVMLTFGVLILVGIKLPRWVWACLWLGVLGGVIFAAWMLDQSLYAIGILCPLCLTVDFSTIMIFGALTQYIFRENLLELRENVHNNVAKFIRMDGAKVMTVALILLAILLIYLRFGNALFA